MYQLSTLAGGAGGAGKRICLLQGRECKRVPSGKNMVLLINIYAGCRRHKDKTQGVRLLMNCLLTLWLLETTSNKSKIKYASSFPLLGAGEEAFFLSRWGEERRCRQCLSSGCRNALLLFALFQQSLELKKTLPEGGHLKNRSLAALFLQFLHSTWYSGCSVSDQRGRCLVFTVGSLLKGHRLSCCLWFPCLIS